MALGACSAPDQNPAFEARDSAGVRIVRNLEPLRGPGEGISVSEEPIVVIGAAMGPEEDLLTNIADAAVLPDGGIVLVDGGAAELHLRAPDGTFTRKVGRLGAGPGEFESPEWLSIRGDTLMVFDPFQETRRLTLLDLSGELLGTETVRPPCPALSAAAP
jgi:hypothetical protein